MRKLSELKQGDTAIVRELLSTNGMRRRLQDIGLIEGTKVKCLYPSPSGEPIAYLIRGAVIALRCEESNNIIVI